MPPTEYTSGKNERDALLCGGVFIVPLLTLLFCVPFPLAVADVAATDATKWRYG